jgi:hypothetical protein
MEQTMRDIWPYFSVMKSSSFWSRWSFIGFCSLLLKLVSTVRQCTEWVAKQLPAEIFHHCSCIRKCILLEEHYTGCQHSTSFVCIVFHNILSTLLWSLVAWIAPWVLHSRPKKQFSEKRVKLFWLIWWVCVHPVQVHPAFITCYFCDVIEERIATSVVLLQGSQSWKKPFSAFCGCPWAISETILRKTSDVVA